MDKFPTSGSNKNITNHSFADWVNGVYRIEKGKMVKEIVYDDVEWEFLKFQNINT